LRSYQSILTRRYFRRMDRSGKAHTNVKEIAG
jgi:hypothetical protein